MHKIEGIVKRPIISLRDIKSVIPHGHHINKTSSNMAMEKTRAYPPYDRRQEMMMNKMFVWS